MAPLYRLFTLALLLSVCQAPQAFGDTVPPAITLLGPDTLYLEQGRTLNDPGATAWDDVDGDITHLITRSGWEAGYEQTPDTHQLAYNVSDAAGNAATPVYRLVVVIQDTTKPTIKLKGPPHVRVAKFSDYEELGWEVHDNFDPSPQVFQGGSFWNQNQRELGGVYISYAAVDAAGNVSDSVYRYFEWPIGAVPAAINSNLHVFPNPVSDLLNIPADNDGERATITILDMQGRIVRTVEETAIGKRMYQVDVGSLPGGTYIVRKQTATGIGTAKVSVVR